MAIGVGNGMQKSLDASHRNPAIRAADRKEVSTIYEALPIVEL